MSNTTSTCTPLKQFPNLYFTPNITHQVLYCPQNCNLAWGSGNPDLSGIGVFWSYTLQLALCTVLGPFYPLLHRYLTKHGRRNLSSVVLMVFITTTLFAAPIAVASALYLNRHPALFDVEFVYYLNVMEFLAGLMLFVTLERQHRNDEDAAHLHDKQEVRLFIGAVLHATLFVLVMYGVGENSLSNPTIHAFVSACSSLGVAVPTPPMSHAPWPRGTRASVQEFLTILITVLCVILALFLISCARDINREYEDHPHYSKVKSALRMLASTGLIAGMAYCYAKMYMARQKLAYMARDEFQDNAWGFGQIVALFVWLPLIVELLIPLGRAVGSHAMDVSLVVFRSRKTKKDDGASLLPQANGDSNHSAPPEGNV